MDDFKEFDKPSKNKRQARFAQKAKDKKKDY
jgi:hypothetical protein